MNFKQNQDSLKKNLIWVFVVVGALLLYTVLSNNKITPSYSPPSTKAFYMSNNLMCEINKSTEKEEISKSISLLNLETNNPRVLFPSGRTYDMKKVSDTESILVIQFVSPTSGSTDSITLYKDTGEFIRDAKGSFLGNYSESSSGKCK